MTQSGTKLVNRSRKVTRWSLSFGEANGKERLDPHFRHQKRPLLKTRLTFYASQVDKIVTSDEEAKKEGVKNPPKVGLFSICIYQGQEPQLILE